MIDGRPVSEDYVTEFIDRWTPEVERIGATFFEATTAMAFAAFAGAGVDAAVIETGLGGRLDSTNVVRPVVAGVTSIGIDHVEYLGNSRDEIAAEKAGIFKAGIPAAVGERDPAVARLLSDLAGRAGARPVASVWRDLAPRDIAVGDDGTRFTLAVDGAPAAFHTPLIGAHQASNTALALLMLQLSGAPFYGGPAEFREALPAVRLPGRFHRHDSFIFDVAHNPDGATVLAATLDAVRVRRPMVVLLTVLADKDWRGLMSALAPAVDVFLVTNAPSAPASRAWSAADAGAFARGQGWATVVDEDFDSALALAPRLGQTVLVTGSFHTVGDAMARLQVDPLAR